MNIDIVNDNRIEDLIYEINGRQVMLDSDLAILYKCKNGTKEINQAVKNNPDKFPERFSWKLNDNESKSFLVKYFDQKKRKEEVDLKILEYLLNRVLLCWQLFYVQKLQLELVLI